MSPILSHVRRSKRRLQINLKLKGSSGKYILLLVQMNVMLLPGCCCSTPEGSKFTVVTDMYILTTIIIRENFLPMSPMTGEKFCRKNIKSSKFHFILVEFPIFCYSCKARQVIKNMLAHFKFSVCYVVKCLCKQNVDRGGAILVQTCQS